MSKPLLEVKNLIKHFPQRSGLFGQRRTALQAVNGVSFTIEAGQTFGLVGESGCGKSTLGRCILRLHEPTSGSVHLDGVNLASLNGRDLRLHRKHMQMIFQDPFASLNPRMTIAEILVEPMRAHRVGTSSERIKLATELLEVVGLRSSALGKYPHEFSGGQRQRVGIARALILRPKIIVADEPVSALDVSVQAQILNLMADIQKQFGVAYLFIAHDLAVVQHVSDEIGVMYLGNIVERADARSLFQTPLHPYTKMLIAAVPKLKPTEDVVTTKVEGEVPSAFQPPSGCRFHNRCPYAMPVCIEVTPPLVSVKNDDPTRKDRWVACHLYEKMAAS